MAEVTGSDFLFGIKNGPVVGGATGVTTETTANLIDIITKQGGSAGKWNRRLAGLKAHTHSVDFNYLKGGSDVIGRENAMLEYEVGSAFTEIPGVTEISLGMEMSLEPRGGLDLQRWSYFIPNRKDISLSLTMNYIDSADSGDGADFTQAVQDALDNDTALTFRLSIGTFSVQGDVKVSDTTLSTDPDAIAPYQIELSSNGVWTKTDGDSDSGFQALLANFFADAPDEIDFISGRLDENGDPIVGTTLFEGSGYATSLEISVPDEDEITASAEVTGSGPMTSTEVSA